VCRDGTSPHTSEDQRLASVEETGAIQIMSVSIEGLDSDGRLLLALELLGRLEGGRLA